MQRGLHRYVEVYERYVEGVERCEEVHGGVCRYVIGGMESAWRYMEVCRGVQRLAEVYRSMCKCVSGVWRSGRCI